MKFRRAPKSKRRNDPAQTPRVSTNNYYRSVSRPVVEGKKLQPLERPTAHARFRSVFKNTTVLINSVILVIIAVILLSATTLSSTVALQLNESDYTYRESTEYLQAAEQLLSQGITRKSKLLFRSTPYEQELKDRFPELSQIDAIVPLGGRELSLALRTQTPLLRVQSGANKGVITYDGLLVDDITAGAELPLLRFATPQESFTKGSRLLTTEEVELLDLLMTELASLEIDGSRLPIKEVLFSVLDGQMSVSFSNQSFQVRYSIYADAAQQVGASIATLRQLDREAALPEKYIDVRVPGRVFVL